MSNVCEHGQLRRQCPHCENIESDKRISALESALSEIREVWAGSDGFIPETCPEGYLQKLCKQQYEIACEALKEVK